MLTLVLAAAAAAACQADPARRELPAAARTLAAFTPKGWSAETKAAFDLDGDGKLDQVLVVAAPDNERRKVVAALATPQGLRNVGEASLPGYPLGPANLEFNARGVLVVTDLTGGTTANQTVMRYRFDPAAGAMRLIGLDVSNYSRTNQHDETTLSFNYLTGGSSLKIDRLTKRGDYAPGKPRLTKGEAQCRFMEDTPDPDDLMSAELDGRDKR